MDYISYSDTKIYFEIDKIAEIILNCFENDIKTLPVSINYEDDVTKRMLGMISGMKYAIKYNTNKFDKFVTFINDYLLLPTDD